MSVIETCWSLLFRRRACGKGCVASAIAKETDQYVKAARNYWNGSPGATTDVALGDDVRPWREPASRTRTLGPRSRYVCVCVRAVPVLGFAKASDGANANNNAMEIFILISNPFLSSAVIGRAGSGSGFKIWGQKDTRKQACLAIRRTGECMQYRQNPAACHQNSSSPVYRLQSPKMQATPQRFYTWICNSFAIKAY